MASQSARFAITNLLCYNLPMQKKIHPTYNATALATCVCGATYVVGSTSKEINVEICSSCHPFYTGKENILDTAGRVDRFKKRTAAAAATKTAKAKKAV